MITVFAVIYLIGYLLISRVPQMLHTPLMSMTNAISAVTVLGAILLFSIHTTLPNKLVGAVAIAAAVFNIAGGLVITDRMLSMFRRKDVPRITFGTDESAETSATPHKDSPAKGGNRS
jgi:NAD(P) transhydrogenase subunit alpha